MSIPTFRWRLSARIAVVLAGILQFTVGLSAAAAPDGAALLARAQRLGSVNVIVDLRTTPDVNQLLGRGLSGTMQQHIRSMQDRLLGRLRDAGIGRAERFAFTPQMALRVSATQLADLLQDGDVAAVREDKLNKPLLGQSAPLIFPNHLTSPYTGAGWVVAVLDSGVDKTHPFLQGPAGSKVLSEACYSGGRGRDPTVFSMCPGGGFQSTAPGSGMPCRLTGCAHGTHVAGIAVGAGSGMAGVARYGRLIAIQVFSGYNSPESCSPASSPCPLAYDSDIIAGLQRVLALRNTFSIAAVNLSLGGGAYAGFCDNNPSANALKPTIDLLKSVNIATVIAVGNGDRHGIGYPDKLSSPACISSAIAVGSTTDTGPGSTSGVKDSRSTYSNNGIALDLYAPGEIITSSVPSGNFANFRGTSMAAPHVAGAFAVLRSRRPKASVDTILAALEATGKPISYAGITRPRINVQQALNWTAPPSPGRRSSIAPILQLLLLDD